MKRTDLLIKVVTLVVFLALVAYIGYSVVETKKNPMKTVAAIAWDVSDSVSTEGYIVRDETVMAYRGGNVYVSAAEGQKVSAGQAVAVGYTGDGALERAEEMRQIRLEIEQYAKVKEANSGDDGAKDSVRGLAAVVASGNLENLDAAALDVKVNVFADAGNYSDATLNQKIGELRARLDSLMAQTGTDMRELTADASGTFSSEVDGFESVSPENVMTMTPTQLTECFSASKKADEANFGKLISGIKWYYVTAVDTATAGRLEQGGKVTLDFSKTYSGSIPMTVEKIGQTENGKCVAVFSSKRGIHEVSAIRNATAEIVFSRTSGIRVPRGAVHLDEEGNAYVYVLIGMQAEKQPVDIAAENGEYYLVKSADGGLAEGSAVIVRANGISDGKVVVS